MKYDLYVNSVGWGKHFAVKIELDPKEAKNRAGLKKG